MGAMMAKLLQLFQTKKMDIVLVGIENSGKTTLSTLLAKGQVLETTPTIGLLVKVFRYGGISMKVWDLGGNPQGRNEWGRYTKGCDVIVYVVDVSDARRIDSARHELHRLLEDPDLHQLPLLVLGNKIDVEPHLSHEELIKGLNLDYITDQSWEVIDISAIKRQGITEVLDWLVRKSKK